MESEQTESTPTCPALTSPTFEDEFKKLAKALDDFFNSTREVGEQKIGFALFAFQPPTTIKYISNCKREDVINTLRPFVGSNDRNRAKRERKTSPNIKVIK